MFFFANTWVLKVTMCSVKVYRATRMIRLPAFWGRAMCQYTLPHYNFGYFVLCGDSIRVKKAVASLDMRLLLIDN